jgi:hypothetical protein
MILAPKNSLLLTVRVRPSGLAAAVEAVAAEPGKPDPQESPIHPGTSASPVAAVAAAAAAEAEAEAGPMRSCTPSSAAR